tara:strand:- start:6050 stop:6745 length:696 start_codon:yes stop_codon:yes gene_type:complete
MTKQQKKWSDDELVSRAREQLAGSRPDSTLPIRTDAPMRSAYSDNYIREKRESETQSLSTSGRGQNQVREKSLADLFLDTLKDIYYAERQIVKALPKLAKAASSRELKVGFEQHLQETEGHVERLEQIFELLGKPARGKTSDAILGIIDEGMSIMEEFSGSEALDAGLISASHAIEHYQIARYSTLKDWAQQLGMEDAAALLDATLQEEIGMDKMLVKLSADDEGYQVQVA